jgi:hypothetical protein
MAKISAKRRIRLVLARSGARLSFAFDISQDFRVRKLSVNHPCNGSSSLKTPGSARKPMRIGWFCLACPPGVRTFNVWLYGWMLMPILIWIKHCFDGICSSKGSKLLSCEDDSAIFPISDVALELSHKSMVARGASCENGGRESRPESGSSLNGSSGKVGAESGHSPTMDNRWRSMMTGKRETGLWQEFSDARGIDAQYAQDKARADKELADAIAGPDNWDVVMPDDIEVKNPGGELQFPSAMYVAPGTVGYGDRK